MEAKRKPIASARTAKSGRRAWKRRSISDLMVKAVASRAVRGPARRQMGAHRRRLRRASAASGQQGVWAGVSPGLARTTSISAIRFRRAILANSAARPESGSSRLFGRGGSARSGVTAAVRTAAQESGQASSGRARRRGEPGQRPDGRAGGAPAPEPGAQRGLEGALRAEQGMDPDGQGHDEGDERDERMVKKCQARRRQIPQDRDHPARRDCRLGVLPAQRPAAAGAWVPWAGRRGSGRRPWARATAEGSSRRPVAGMPIERCQARRASAKPRASAWPLMGPR